MAVVEIEEIPALLQAGKTIAGLDLGTKTIGLAVSDLGLSFAHPRPVIKRTKFSIDAQVLLKALNADKVGAIVIGLPMNMDGTSGPRVQATRAFVRTMQPLTDLPFVFWDERLSTVAAERALIGMDVSRGKRAERIDSAAAAFILQGALDRLHGIRRSVSDDYDVG
ncbi:Holliday junction resolvase RuvX [Brucella pseudintermedia]|uniref:Holliday junction resolvase RuvX n=1 Tax=Brucella pseudintermedia TaxID=370111 RepID=UPI0015895BE4|nr:Holliday junction resolvase RuvX [Brucella pseudintermedia]